MEDIDLSDHKVTSEVHVFSEGEHQDEEESIGKEARKNLLFPGHVS